MRSVPMDPKTNFAPPIAETEKDLVCSETAAMAFQTLVVQNNGCYTQSGQNYGVRITVPGRDAFWLRVGGIGGSSPSDNNIPVNTVITGEVWLGQSGSWPFGGGSSQKVSDFTVRTGQTAVTTIFLDPVTQGGCAVVREPYHSGGPVLESKAPGGMMSPRGMPMATGQAGAPVVTTLQGQPPVVIVQQKKGMSWIWWVLIIIGVWLLYKYFHNRSMAQA